MNASFRGAQRSLDQWVATARPLDASGPILETVATRAAAPRLVASDVVEGGPALARLTVPGSPEVGFSAFLDGTQQSRLLAHIGGVPIVWGTVAAVIRIRRDRRMSTYGDGPLVERSIYGPATLLPPIEGIVDTGPVDPDEVHPSLLLEQVVHVVQEHRERVERQLADRWCASESAPLWIDGGLTAISSSVVGVVKSHRTLHVDRIGLQVVCALGAGERTTVVRVTSKHRTPVLSWYLRLRDPAGRGPLWGLVRIEVAEAYGDITERAHVISRWVLAEVAPLSLPDPRWDTLVYGVRDCEEYLRAIS
jgi:hypothetical protein